MNKRSPAGLDELLPQADLRKLAAALIAICEEQPTFLTADQVASLASCVLEPEDAGREGILVEAGTARGGSAIAIALAKSNGRELRVYDVFEMISPPTEEDGEDVVQRYAEIADGRARGRDGDDVYYKYRDDLLGEVTASFARHGVPIREHSVSLVAGLSQDTLAYAYAYAGADRLDLDPHWNALPIAERIDTPGIVDFAGRGKPWEAEVVPEGHRYRRHVESFAGRAAPMPAPGAH